ncbi:hypothetical protein BD770DRAFT_376006 [Pilaira anomala]|nr:hypothetical protein BD770DRAFT_376006 [Pilaira anomala]
MKRQLHLRMKFGKNIHEIETFGVLVIGTEITLFKLNMDMTKWVYIYEELGVPFTLPTTHGTYSHTEVSMKCIGLLQGANAQIS